MPSGHTIPAPALLLGWFGVVPFAALTAAALLLPHAALQAVQTLVLYGAIILSFMGGAQWGLAMHSGAEEALATRLAVSVLPALAAFALALEPARVALIGLAAVFLLLLIYDFSTVRGGLAPLWYARLRLQLTLAVVLCLLLAGSLMQL